MTNKPRPPAPVGFFKNGEPHVNPADCTTYTDGMPRPEFTEARKLSPLAKPPSRRCQVCTHPEKVRIEALKVSGVSIDKLGAMFNVHRDAVHRHCKNHMSEATRASHLMGPAKIGELANQAADENRSVMDYLKIMIAVLMNQFTREAELNRPYAVERVGGRLLDTIREMGSITGEVSKLAGTVINIQNNTQILNSAPFLELQAGLLSVCAAHPEARADIVALFRDLDIRHAPPAGKQIEHQPIQAAE